MEPDPFTSPDHDCSVRAVNSTASRRRRSRRRRSTNLPLMRLHCALPLLLLLLRHISREAILAAAAVLLVRRFVLRCRSVEGGWVDGWAVWSKRVSLLCSALLCALENEV